MTTDGWRAVLAVATVAVSLATGCSRTDHRIPDAVPIEPAALYQPFTDAQGLPEAYIDRPPYRLNVGDILEVIYQVRNVATEKPYDLKIEDRIRLMFPYQERFSQELTVQADGSIRCLLVGRVRAQGLSAGDLEEQLRRAYARYIKDPELTVVVEAANVKIVELKKAITTAPRGQSRLVPIKPDGTIDLPYVGEAPVAGKTVSEAKHMLDEMYMQNDLEEVEVTVQTLEFAPRRIYVLGEVMYPTLVEAQVPTSVIQAIIRAGGPTVRAEKSKILVVRRHQLPLPQAIVFDMQSVLEGQKPGPDGRVPDASRFRHDFYLADGDIVYVPASDLAKAGDWIDQVFTRGIRAIFPYSGVVGMNFGYQIYEAESAVKSKIVGPPNINAQLGP